MLIGTYTDKDGNRWDTYKSNNPEDVLGPFYQRKIRPDEEVGSLAVRGMDSPALRRLAEEVIATGEICHHSECACEGCRAEHDV
jgi:hypothetical protein